jgi:hypothetical protein
MYNPEEDGNKENPELKYCRYTAMYLGMPLVPFTGHIYVFPFAQFYVSKKFPFLHFIKIGQ